jgi:hypothetical protein
MPKDKSPTKEELLRRIEELERIVLQLPKQGES